MLLPAFWEPEKLWNGGRPLFMASYTGSSQRGSRLFRLRSKTNNPLWLLTMCSCGPTRSCAIWSCLYLRCCRIFKRGLWWRSPFRIFRIVGDLLWVGFDSCRNGADVQSWVGSINTRDLPIGFHFKADSVLLYRRNLPFFFSAASVPPIWAEQDWAGIDNELDYMTPSTIEGAHTFTVYSQPWRRISCVPACFIGIDYKSFLPHFRLQRIMQHAFQIHKTIPWNIHVLLSRSKNHTFTNILQL